MRPVNPNNKIFHVGKVTAELPKDSEEIPLHEVSVGGEPLVQFDNGVAVYDTTMSTVFGTQSLLNLRNRLKVSTDFEDVQVVGRIGASNEALGIDCAGKQTVLVQLAGTWTGTVTFEARGNSGNFQTINGVAPNGSALVSTTTANGIFRFNTGGHTRFQARFSTATTGTVQLALIASAELSLVSLGAPVQGSQLQPLTQRASSYELSTFDTYLSGTLTRPTVDPAPIAPSAPTLPSSYVSNFLGKFPQIYPRARVEIGGDQRLPLAQDPLTKRLSVQYDEGTRLLEEILLQLKMLNQATMQANNITPPRGWEEIR